MAGFQGGGDWEYIADCQLPIGKRECVAPSFSIDN
jgi:hypothetical protein